MKLKLSYRLSIYIGSILLLGIGLLLFHEIRSDENLIEEIGLSEAERLSNILFDQLHTSMKLGGGRAENRSIVERFKKVKEMEGIRVIHGPALDRQYGVEEDELPEDRYERSALAGNTVRKIVKQADGYSVASYILPIHMRDECRRCHRAATGDVMGAVSVELSLEKFEMIMERHTGRMLIWGLGILSLTLCAVLITMHKRFLAPVKRLKAGAGVLAKGDLSHRVNITTDDEFGELGESFDEMAASLLDINKKLNSINFKHARLVEMAADAIVLIDLETQRLVDANPAAEMLSGYSIEELRGRASDELFPAEKLDEYRRVFSRWVHDGKGYLHDALIAKKDGFTVPVEIAASVLEIEGRSYIQEIWRDTSERKGFEEKLKKHISELEDTVKERTKELNRSLGALEEAYGKLKDSEQRLIQSAKLVSLGEMGAGIAHELNSPIAGILSISEVLLGRLSKADPNYFLLEKIKDAAVRSKYIILDMLTYSRPKKGEFKPVYMNETIRATLTIFVSELKARSIEIVEDFDPELPRVNANQGQLMEVVLNILKNARDASGDNGRIFITTRTRDEAGRTCVVAEIKDTGPGIPPGVIDRIFDPFFSTKEKGGGLNIGLGLSISQSIVKEHGGRIEAENAGGAVFRVVLPIAEASEKA